jgi:hypothetical protein
MLRAYIHCGWIRVQDLNRHCLYPQEIVSLHQIVLSRVQDVLML